MRHPFEFPLELPASGSRQRLRALYGQLRAAILDGRLQPGARLPATRELASTLAVSRNTVVAAYERLLGEGYVEARRGAGNFVADLAGRAAPAARAAGAADDRLAPAWRGWSEMPQPMRLANHALDFRVGLPDHRQFPFDVWRRLAARAWRGMARSGALYDAAQGRPVLREAIARHVAFARAVACVPDDVIVTSGAQQAFDLLARVLVVPGQTTVAVEDPGYPPVRDAFTAAGAHVVGVPVDEEGLVVERLPPDARVIYATPSHQFPLGVVLSPRRRAALLEFAQACGATVIEDDYDSEFRYGERPLDALQTLDRAGVVCYVGTFSKCLFPALRLGYLVAPPWLRSAVAHAKRLADWHCDAAAQDTLAAFIAEGHLARHVRRMRKLYAERRAVLLDALARHGDRRLTPWPSGAGLHLAVQLAAATRAEALVSRAAAQGIHLETLGSYALQRDAPNGLALGFGLIEAGRIDAAIGRVADLLER